MKNAVQIMKSKKNYKVALNDFAAVIFGLCVLIAISVFTLDVVKHPERYSTIYKYQSSIQRSSDW